jgi:hypothetical protein
LYKLEANENHSATINCHVDCYDNEIYNPILLLINAKDANPLEIPAATYTNKTDYRAVLTRFNNCNASNNYTDYEYDIYLLGDRLDDVVIACGLDRLGNNCWGQTFAVVNYNADNPVTNTMSPCPRTTDEPSTTNSTATDDQSTTATGEQSSTATEEQSSASPSTTSTITAEISSNVNLPVQTVASIVVILAVSLIITAITAIVIIAVLSSRLRELKRIQSTPEPSPAVSIANEAAWMEIMQRNMTMTMMQNPPAPHPTPSSTQIFTAPSHRSHSQ